MDNAANQAYLTAIINGYERKINKNINKNKGLTQTTTTTMLKEVVATLGDLSDFISDKKATEGNYSLTLNADLTEYARAYKASLAQKQSVINDLNYDNNYKNKLNNVICNNLEQLETENKMLEADNLKLNNQLALQEAKRKELFQECSEAEIENAKYEMEIIKLNKALRKC